jgi:hypothetical protein
MRIHESGTTTTIVAKRVMSEITAHPEQFSWPTLSRIGDQEAATGEAAVAPTGVRERRRSKNLS